MVDPGETTHPSRNGAAGTADDCAAGAPDKSIGSNASAAAPAAAVDPLLHLTSKTTPATSTHDDEAPAPGVPIARMKLEDWAKLIQRNDDFAHVSLEQLERIKVVHDRFLEGCTLSFNYNTLILVASVIAGLGLVSNSVATIIASMLVSPLMGPVVGMAYGTTIRDWAMVRTSVVNECGSLVFCILMGAVIGAITGTTELAHEWPTPEMVARGSPQNFLVGLPIAFFSGLGVAVSLLDDQFSSLVGVAISASLLPPAVNAGILWVAYGFYASDKWNDSQDVLYQPQDFRQGGLLSLLLTLANIVLIWISSMIMFRLKEVLPIRKKVFWGDLGVARKIFRRRALLVPDATALEEAGGGGTFGAAAEVAPSPRSEQIYRQASTTIVFGRTDGGSNREA